jgi:GNAT superfamily N-acetyltransferase
MDLEIRIATPNDIPIVTELVAAMDGDAPMPLVHAVRVFSEMSRFPSYHCYLAFSHGEPVGTFSLLIFPTLVRNGAREALVESVVVAPRLRRRGIGAAMMREARRITADAGCYKLCLSSSSKRQDAHRFYRSLGFQQHGVSFSIDTDPRCNG